jgi:hypothetical protein
MCPVQFVTYVSGRSLNSTIYKQQISNGRLRLEKDDFLINLNLIVCGRTDVIRRRTSKAEALAIYKSRNQSLEFWQGSESRCHATPILRVLVSKFHGDCAASHLSITGDWGVQPHRRLSLFFVSLCLPVSRTLREEPQGISQVSLPIHPSVSTFKFLVHMKDLLIG